MAFYCWYYYYCFTFYIQPDSSRRQSENRHILLPRPVKGYFEGRIYNSRNGLVIARQSFWRIYYVHPIKDEAQTALF
jgi:hypothetical protein